MAHARMDCAVRCMVSVGTRKITVSMDKSHLLMFSTPPNSAGRWKDFPATEHAPTLPSVATLKKASVNCLTWPVVDGGTTPPEEHHAVAVISETDFVKKREIVVQNGDGVVQVVHIVDGGA
jgi:hypothetical protein